MTGKRPRALRRTPSESIIESESVAHEFSPLPEHPKEEPKPTLNESVRTSPRRLVIGFNPKPLPENGDGDACSKPSSPNGVKSPSQRSGLESLLSVPRETNVNEGVGLGIVAVMDTIAHEEELKINIVNRRTSQNDPVATAIKALPILSPNRCYNASSYQPQTQRHFSPIHARGPASELISGPPSQHRFSEYIHPLAGANGEEGRPMLPWLRQSDGEGDCDILLLRSPAFQAQVVVPDVGAAAHFLDACYFCKRHLIDGNDIYMYRGDKAFCSTECRSQQILHDERRENCAVAARKKPSGAPSRRSGVVAAGTAAAA